MNWYNFACPAHDQRDLDFARKYQLPVIDTFTLKNEEAVKYSICSTQIRAGQMGKYFTGVDGPQERVIIRPFASLKNGVGDQVLPNTDCETGNSRQRC